MLKIKIENLFKIYNSRGGRVSALEDINLDIEQNEFITLVGPSGCGKSTLLKIIGALIRPSRGTLLYDGKTAAAANARRRHRLPGASAASLARRARQRAAAGGNPRSRHRC